MTPDSTVIPRPVQPQAVGTSQRLSSSLKILDLDQDQDQDQDLNSMSAAPISTTRERELEAQLAYTRMQLEEARSDKSVAEVALSLNSERHLLQIKELREALHLQLYNLNRNRNRNPDWRHLIYKKSTTKGKSWP